jgi:hypothetical protein
VPANQRTNTELSEAASPVRVGDADHSVTPRHWTDGEIRLIVCSACGPITAKIDEMLQVPDIDPKLRTRLEALRSDISNLETRISNGNVSSRQIVEETGRVTQQINEIGVQHPKLGKALDVPERAGVQDIEIRKKHSEEWGVDPATGKFDPNLRMQGLEASKVDELARQPAIAGEPDVVRRRRRHLQEHKGDEPLPMDKWAESGFTANVNRDVSSPQEVASLAVVGATPNNAAGQGRTFQYDETVDRRGRPDPTGNRTETVVTRPDGTRPNSRGGTDIVEHKHLTGNETVLDDSRQLRAQRAMASEYNGDHEIVMSSDRQLGQKGQPLVSPSGPLGDSGSRIYYYDPTSGRVTHQWVNGAWRRVRPGVR